MEGESKTPKVGNQSVAPEHLTNGAYAWGNGHEGSKASTGEGAQDKAELVLDQYRSRFKSDMDAKAVTMELVHKDIITSGDESEILKNEELRLQNEKLHSCLKNKCTKEALNTVCGVIMEVKGNPKMKALGEDMKRSLSEAIQPQQIVDSSRSTALAKALEDKRLSAMDEELTETAKDGRTLRKRPSASKDVQGPDQAPDESRGAQPEVIPKGVAASQFSVSQFLETYEDEFLEVVNPKLSLLKLKHNGVISSDVRTAIESANDEDAKYTLLEYLQKNATVDTLRVYCDVASKVNGFPRMQELGKKMMDALAPGAYQDPASCPTSDTVWSSAHCNPSGPSDKQATTLELKSTIKLQADLEEAKKEIAARKKHETELTSQLQEVLSQSPLPHSLRKVVRSVKLPDMPMRAASFAATIHNSKVYISAVGKDGNGKLVFPVLVYSTNELKWSKLPEQQSDAAIAVLNNHITLIGGVDVSTRKITNTLSTWYEEEGQWKQVLPPMPTGRYRPSVISHDNLLLVTGGVAEDDSVLNTTDILDLTTMKWTTPQGLSLPIPLWGPHLTLCGEYIYLMRGAMVHPWQSTEDDNSQAWRAKWSDVKQTAAPQHSQPQSGVWTKICDPPTLIPTPVSCGGTLYTVGGRTRVDKLISMVYTYIPARNQWDSVGDMSVRRFRHCAVPLSSNTIFVAGGRVVNEGKPKATFDSLTELLLL